MEKLYVDLKNTWEVSQIKMTIIEDDTEASEDVFDENAMTSKVRQISLRSTEGGTMSP